MCEYFGIRFIGFILKGKGSFDYTTLFSPNESEKDDKVRLKCFQ